MADRRRMRGVLAGVAGVVAAVVAGVVLVAGCGAGLGAPQRDRADSDNGSSGSSDSDGIGAFGGPDSGSGETRGKAPGRPERKRGGKAVPSLVEVPSFGQEFVPVDQFWSDMVEEFTRRCGGTMCVTLETDGGIDRSECGFRGFEPAAGRMVESGRTVTVLCYHSGSPSTEASTDPGTTEQPVDPGDGDGDGPGEGDGAGTDDGEQAAEG